MMGDEGPKGYNGPPGSAGPPGPPGDTGGFDAAQLSQIFGNQNKGPSQADDPNGARVVPIQGEQVLKRISAIANDIMNRRKPRGTQANPGRTCADIAKAHKEFKSGHYWIDPNLGSPKDAVQVYCNMEKGANAKAETCISAAKLKTGVKKLGRTSAQHRWLSKIAGESEFEYKFGLDQLKSLRVLSDGASQTITYHCRNSIAYKDPRGNNYSKAVKLRGADDVELTADGQKGFRYTVTEDGCSRRSHSFAKTVIRYETKNTERLPIVDLATVDIGRSDQQFEVEVGSVCFV